MHTELEVDQANSKEKILCNDSTQDSMDIKQEIHKPLDVPKRPYYQCITCSAIFVKAENLKNHHESIHKGKKSPVSITSQWFDGVL